MSNGGCGGQFWTHRWTFRTVTMQGMCWELRGGLLLEERVPIGCCAKTSLRRLAAEGRVESGRHRRHTYSCLKLELAAPKWEKLSHQHKSANCFWNTVTVINFYWILEKTEHSSHTFMLCVICCSWNVVASLLATLSLLPSGESVWCKCHFTGISRCLPCVVPRRRTSKDH